MSMIIYTAFIMASMGLACYALFFELQRSAVDVARSNLFDLRSKLFELARAGRLDFGSRAYRLHRSLLNGMISYSDDISITHMLITRLQADHTSIERGRQVGREMRADVKRLPADVQKELTSIVRDAHTQMVMLMINRSLLMTVIMRSLWVCSITWDFIVEMASDLWKRMATTNPKNVATIGDRSALHGAGSQWERSSHSHTVPAVANAGIFLSMRSHWETRIDRNAIQLAEAC